MLNRPPSRVKACDPGAVRDGEIVQTKSSVDELCVQPGVESPLEELAARRAVPAVYRAANTDVKRLHDAWVETRMCVAITSNHEYVVDTLRSHRQAEECGYRKVGPNEFVLPEREVVELEGRALLVGLPVGRNYFHWLFEGVARWLLALDEIDVDTRLLIPEIGAMERSALEAAGVPEDRLEVMPREHLLRVQELLVAPRGVRSSVRIIPAAVRALRDLVPSDREARERLFISRSGASRRRLVNEDETLAVLERHGFRAVRTERMSVREQWELFSTAEVVVGVHGAGLTNTVFAPAGATLVELQPPQLDAARVVLYWNLAAAAGQRYVQVVCPEGPDQADTPESERNIVIDPMHLDGVLGRALGPPL